MKRKPSYNFSQRAKELGFRSGLEEAVAKQLVSLGVEAGYETEKIIFTRPARPSKYTPDWILPNGIIIETKGRFKVEDRQKHLHIKKQHPNLDIRFVFSSSKGKISKGSKTTYAMWCEKHGFQFADKWIPEEWVREPTETTRIGALKDATQS